MRRLGPGANAVATIAAAIVLVGGGLASHTVAQTTPDRSDVVLVMDFSASILEDKTTRNRFGAALERIAARVDETSADLVAGDATVSIVQFATSAADLPGCADLKLLDSPATVTRFGNCLRAVAAEYRRGLFPNLTKRIGINTNYVAAMDQAARHLPADAVRPVMILFTDGKHDVKGVPVSRVLPERDRLFGNRSPFALLPVGMGLDPKLRVALATGLENLRITRDMPACVAGAPFEWPTVVFQTAEEAGTAVATALQDATCTFTVAPTPSPTPEPTPGIVKAIRLTASDGRIDVSWTPVAGGSAPIVDYLVRCRAGDGDWINSTEGVSLATSASVEGLTNGTAYECEVATVGATAQGEWTAAAGSITPVGRPPAPGKPSVEPLNGGLRIGVTPEAGANVSKYRFECSPDNGTTWPGTGEVGADNTTALIGGLTNGVNYICRAFAANAIGMSDASAQSDAVRPCGSLLECNPSLLPVFGILGLVLTGGILAALITLFRGRTTGYVIAVVDVVHTANVGHGSNLGIALVRAPGSRVVTGIVADRGSQADVRIHRMRGGRFRVTDKTGRHVVADGEAVVVVDSLGVRHSLVLHAFATNAASRVASRR